MVGQKGGEFQEKEKQGMCVCACILGTDSREAVL